MRQARIALIAILAVTASIFSTGCFLLGKQKPTKQESAWPPERLPTLCGEHKNGVWTMDVGKCGYCSGETSSGAFKFCTKCAEHLGVCQYCEKRLRICDECTKRGFCASETGKCEYCGAETRIDAYRICESCAYKKNQCKVCGKAMK
ncbi:MAG: hypothetical protein G01um10143_248 [Parcubacteria group bacterium Gr01-1014_3]|nr:MAG: hypothetical protein G01um10143_248 [Parcubacteria group bacterium Gr01-1014_3]